ncbi:MAG: bifunctional nuclease domain-containing protein [Candidatus Binatia bacterium]
MWVSLLFAAAALSACHGRDKSEIEVEVRSVGVDNASHAPVVVLQDHDRKVALPIWIGPVEAESIALQMQGINPPRPLTHDLIKTMLDQSGVEFERVVIHDLKESTYYARICLRAGGRDLQIDSRPSDAIALAIRFHKPIFVATALLHGDGSIDLQHAEPAATTIRFSGVTVQNLTDEMADYFSLPPGTGVIIAAVEEDAPQGLQRGDIVLEVDGGAVTGVGDFVTKMRALKGNSAAHLSVQRGSSRVTVEFAARASDQG